MTSTLDHDEERLKRYLLGELDQQEALELERKYLADDGLCEQLEMAAAELCDQYVGRELSLEHARRFETTFLSSPRRRELLRLSQDLHRAARPIPAPSTVPASPAWLSRVAALLVATLGVGWWVTGRLDRPPALPSPRSSPAVTGAGQVTATLLPGLHRTSDRAPRVVVPLGSALVEVDAYIEAPPAFAPEDGLAVLRSAAGAEVWRGEPLTLRRLPPDAVVRLRFPAADLRPGQYVLTLYVRGEQRQDELGSYRFKIAHGEP